MTKPLDDIGDIPPFLDCKRPAVIKRRAAAFLSWREEQIKLAAEKARVSVKPARKPAKSVVTAPGAAKPAPKAKKTPAKVAKKGKKAKYSPEATITVLTKKFPHRVGSQAEAKSALFKDGMSVAQYKAKGDKKLGLPGNWHINHIRYCVDYGFISVKG